MKDSKISEGNIISEGSLSSLLPFMSQLEFPQAFGDFIEAAMQCKKKKSQKEYFDQLLEYLDTMKYIQVIIS